MHVHRARLLLGAGISAFVLACVLLSFGGKARAAAPSYSDFSIPLPVPTATSGIPTATPTPACVLTFTDVPCTEWYYGWVVCLVGRGAISGYNCGGPGEPCDGRNRPYFRPGNNITRGQLAKVAVLAFNVPTNTTGGPHFRDVPTDFSTYTWVETAYNVGIISGYACGGQFEPCPGVYFRPNNYITRGQLTKIVVAAAGWPLLTPPSPTFNDVATTDTFYRYIETANCRGILGGYLCGGPNEPCPGSYFRPTNYLTRAQAAKILCIAASNPPACTLAPR